MILKFGRLFFLRLGASNSYISGLVLLRLGVSNSYVWLLVILTFLGFYLLIVES